MHHKQKPSQSVECLRTLQTSEQTNSLLLDQLEALKCDHEEADTRVVRSVLMSDLPRSVIYANDTDILISTLAQVDRLPNKEIFMRRLNNFNNFLDVSDIGQGIINQRLNLLGITARLLIIFSGGNICPPEFHI